MLRLWAMSVLLCLSACYAPVKPLSRDVTEAMPKTWQNHQNNGKAVVDLINLVEDPRLKPLVEHVLLSNLELEETALRLQESAALLGLSRAAQLPSLDLAVDGNRNGDASGSSNNLSAGFRLNWELDLWGRLADRRQAALGEHAALNLDYLAARRSLAGRTIQMALEVAFRRETLGIETQRVKTLQTNQIVIKQRFENGLGTLADWDTASASLASAQATLDQRQEDLARTLRALAVLRGETRPTRLELPQRLSNVFAPNAMLPATVLANRPDVAAALQRVTASHYSSRAARKDLLPSFNLAANVDYRGRTFSKMLSADPAWSLIGNLLAPLFDGGRRRSQSKASAIAAQRSLVTYRKTLLLAVQEVENAMGVEATLQRQIQSLEQAFAHAEHSRESFEQRYGRGLADVLDLLTAQRTAFDAQLRLLETRYQQLRNRVDLGLALGLEVLR